jgi:hypothetical protein
MECFLSEIQSWQTGDPLDEPKLLLMKHLFLEETLPDEVEINTEIHSEILQKFFSERGVLLIEKEEDYFSREELFGENKLSEEKEELEASPEEILISLNQLKE